MQFFLANKSICNAEVSSKFVVLDNQEIAYSNGLLISELSDWYLFIYLHGNNFCSEDHHHSLGCLVLSLGTCRLVLTSWFLVPIMGGAWANHLIPLHSRVLICKMETIASNHRLVARVTSRLRGAWYTLSRCWLCICYGKLVTQCFLDESASC